MKTAYWIITCIGSFLAGLMFYVEIGHMLEPINCKFPLNFPVEEFVQAKPSEVRAWGLVIHTKDWMVLDHTAYNIYRYECIKSLYTVFMAHGHTDKDLKYQIKQMLEK